MKTCSLGTGFLSQLWVCPAQVLETHISTEATAFQLREKGCWILFWKEMRLTKVLCMCKCTYTSSLLHAHGYNLALPKRCPGQHVCIYVCTPHISVFLYCLVHLSYTMSQAGEVVLCIMCLACMLLTLVQSPILHIVP